MKLTVIFEDNIIVIDGEAADFQPGQISPKDPNHRVIQWKETHGWIEVYEGERIWLEADDEDQLDVYLEKHSTRMEEIDAAEAALQLAIAEAHDQARLAEEEQAEAARIEQERVDEELAKAGK